MWVIFAPIVSWLLRSVIFNFAALTVVYAVLGLVMPLALGYLAPYVGGGSLTTAFNSIPAGMWFFLDFFALDYGIPIILSAYIARFLIRRLPMIG